MDTASWYMIDELANFCAERRIIMFEVTKNRGKLLLYRSP